MFVIIENNTFFVCQQMKQVCEILQINLCFAVFRLWGSKLVLMVLCFDPPELLVSPELFVYATFVYNCVEVNASVMQHVFLRI